MKLEYICNDCGREITSSEYGELEDLFCPDCKGHVEENTEKIWCFTNSFDQLIGPFYESDLCEALKDKQIYAETEIFNLKSLEWNPLREWKSLGSVLQPNAPVSKPVIPVEEDKKPQSKKTSALPSGFTRCPECDRLNKSTEKCHYCNPFSSQEQEQKITPILSQITPTGHCSSNANPAHKNFLKELKNARNVVGIHLLPAKYVHKKYKTIANLALNVVILNLKGKSAFNDICPR